MACAAAAAKSSFVSHNGYNGYNNYTSTRLLRLVTKTLRRLTMENASVPTDVWNDVTTASDDLSLDLTSIRDLALKVVYIIIGAIGVIDNLFVIIVFILYIKITEKVLHNTPTIITVDLCDFHQLSIHIPAAFRV